MDIRLGKAECLRQGGSRQGRDLTWLGSSFDADFVCEIPGELGASSSLRWGQITPVSWNGCEEQ